MTYTTHDTPLRERLVDAVRDEFLSPTVTPTGGTEWKRAFRAPPDGRVREAKNVLVLITESETYARVLSHDKLDRTLPVELRSISYIDMSTDIDKGAVDVLADMEEIVARDTNWGGLALGTDFVANDILKSDTADRVVQISLFINLRYRTKYASARTYEA